MRVLSLTGLVTHALLVSTTTAAKCASPPINLPYRSISTVPGVLSPGIPLQIGSPWQSIAIVPSLQIDDTFLPRYTNTCIYDTPINTTSTQPQTNRTIQSHVALTDLHARDASPGSFSTLNENGAGIGEDWFTRCAQTYGGAYQPSLSPSFQENRTNNQAFHFFTDIWRFGDYADAYATTNDALPLRKNLSSSFQIAEEGKTFSGYGSALLGLTPNSTILNALRQADMIPSTSWSLTNDSLCLGCEDRAASTGAWHTFHPSNRYVNPDLPCLIKAKVEALNWRPREHGVEGATLIQETFTACVDPGVQFLVLPTNATSAFEKIVGGNVSAEYDDYTVFEGSGGNDTGVLTFRIEGGLEVNVTIPGPGDVAPEKEGEWTVPVGKGGWGAYGNQTWVLGKVFTDRVVLRWDGEQQEYGIANRNTNPAAKIDLQPLGCDEFLKLEKSITLTPGTGILVGSVVGGFIGGLAFAFAGFWFFKWGQKGVRSKYAQLDEDTVPMCTMSHGRDSTAGALSPPPPSIHESLRSQRLRDTRPGAQSGRGFEIADGQMFEAPEGGTIYPTKRGRNEM
ncbi:uncharacterized protein N0V89_002704 [Didymosphaeria variabile]|uniref:Peptidase A1 domain-containing protein n=1 Tax=Didymosphaeria variabile TaxID=1932322 RepID=A0A9W8XUT4_9PLEO|nr:uncharacterized protein N0V89_002704 [Didymosphaeria variabile]KAJ4358125.1 hypothetical protein N0V89_002704 [Didymosphaeria variabile]